MLEVPSEIYSHTKHLWDDIQAKLQANTDDNTPFALLPVRLETRFMKVKRKWSPYVQSHDTIAIWDGLSHATDKFDTLAAHKYGKANQEITAYNEISDRLNVIAGQVESDSSSYSDGAKQAINETVDFLKTSISQKTIAVEENRDLTTEEKAEFVANLAAIDSQCDTLKTAIQAKEETSEANSTQTEQSLIDQKQSELNTILTAYNSKASSKSKQTSKDPGPALDMFSEKLGSMNSYLQMTIKDGGLLLEIFNKILADIELVEGQVVPLGALSEGIKPEFESKLNEYNQLYNNFLSKTSKIVVKGNLLTQINDAKSRIPAVLTNIQNSINGGAISVSAEQVLTDSNKVVSDTNAIKVALNDVSNVSAEDKQSLSAAISAYETTLNSFLEKSGQVTFDERDQGSYDTMRVKITANLNGYADQISGITVAESSAASSQEELLSTWKSPIYESGIEEGGLKVLKFSQYRIVSELWVRIFPDDIHIHTHENPLTADEIIAGTEYWTTWWNSGGDIEIRKGAWKALCEEYGPQRAAWIKDQMEPNNLPQEPVDDDSVNFAINNVFQAASDLVSNVVVSDTFESDNVFYAGESLLLSANDLSTQFARTTLSGEAKEALNTAIDNYDAEMEQFNDLVVEAERANIQINEEELIAIDFEDRFKGLSQTLLELRDPSRESQFSVGEWINTVSGYTETVDQFRIDVERGVADLNSLRGGSKAASTLLGSIYSNERIIGALETGKRDDPMYEVIQGRVEGQSEPMMNAMNMVKQGLQGFKVATQGGIKKFKLWEVGNHVQQEHVLYQAQEVFGQIKQNIASTPEPDPWNPFDHFDPTDPDNPIDLPSPDTKDGAWTQAPKTFVLPDRFVAIGLNEEVTTTPSSANYGKNSYEFKQLEVGNLVPAELHVGIDPTIDDDSIYQQLPDGSLVVDDNMKWMVDFNDAVAKGMGIIMELEEDFEAGQPENVFDKLVVMGVKVEKNRFHKPDAEKDYSGVSLKDYSKELMEELLINHHYKEDGMGITTIGTPTNNTENEESGWKPDMVHFEDTFEVEAMNNLFPIRMSHEEQRNGQRLADALGVDYGIFQHIQNAGSTEIGDGFKFNKMLWHGTIGNYFQEMLSGLVSRSNYEKVKDYYERYVSARGILPTLRVGEQPYGFQPVSSFTKWSFGVEIGEDNMKHPARLNENTLHNGEGLPTNDYYRINRYYNSVKNKRFDAGFKTLLDLLQNRWYGLFHQPGLIKHVNGVGDTNDFMQALGLHASTAEIQLRFPYSIANLFEGSNPLFPNSFGTVSPSDFFGMNILDPAWTNLVKNGLFHEGSMAFSEDNIANHIQYLQSHFQISKNPVDKYKVSEHQMINRSLDNYMEWIRTADLRYIWDPTADPDNPFSGSTAPLLFKLLRQSYLMMHLDAFVDVSVKSGLLDQNMYHTLSNGDEITNSLISAGGGNIGTADDRFSKWAFLLENISDFSGSTGAFAHLNDYKVVLDQYMSDKNISFDTTNFTFAQHVQNYYSNFWKMKGGHYNKLKIAELDKIYKVAKTWSTGHIDRLFRENLDLGSYRLDAWMNGFVNRRLERTRRSHQGNSIKYATLGQRSREKGVYLGAYGWLENVKPGGNRTAIDSEDKLPASLEIANTTIFKDDDNLGFIHGPSVYHAMTAAILRSGYVSNEDVVTNVENPMAINLSSERVRMAKNLWEGIKNGQNLGALLGYQLERNLHELYSTVELDTYIYKLRSVYPIEEYHTGVTDTEAESIPAQNVINGINLLGDIREAMKTSGTTLSLYQYLVDNIQDPSDPPAKKWMLDITDPIAEIISREIDLMANAIDALGDLAVAEGVFQMSRGNFDRASTTIDTLINNRNLPLPEILDTPRTGAQVSHRFCVNMDLGTNVLGTTVINPWSGIALTEKALAAPHINQYIAKYFPSPDDIKCVVKYDDGGSIEEYIVSVTDLEWQPIDFYTIVQFAVSNDKNEELLSRIANYAREHAPYDGGTGIPYDVELTILLNEEGTTWATTDYTFMELLPIIESVSKVIAEIRPIKIQDFKMPELTLIEDDYGWDLSELDTRLNTALTTLDNLIATPLSPTPDYTLLLHSAENYNVPHASPKSADPVELAEQWLVVKDQLSILSAGATEILTGPDGVSSTTINDDQKWKKYLEVAQIIFGSDFVLLPVLDLTTDGIDTALNTYLTTNQTPLMSEVGASPGFDQDALGQWFYGLSRMRGKLGHFETLCDFDSSDSLEFSPLQFPYISDTGAGTHDFWYGWEFPETYEPTGNKTSIVMTDKTAFSTAITDQKMVGFVLDQWSETIPEKKEASGIAFHYDQPNTKPPQNVLLAVTPEFTGNWDGNDILFTLLDTIKMSKVRLVEPEHIQTDPFLGKYLPTTYSLIKLKLNNYNFAVEYIANTAAIS